MSKESVNVLSLNEYIAKNNTEYNFMAYGATIGKFNIPLTALPTIILEKKFLMNTAIVEHKKEFFRMIWDIAEIN